jgi:hypothetical protein
MRFQPPPTGSGRFSPPLPLSGLPSAAPRRAAWRSWLLVAALVAALVTTSYQDLGAVHVSAAGDGSGGRFLPAGNDRMAA